MEGGITIHLAPSALAYIGDFAVTNTLITAITVSILLVAFAFFAGRSLRLKPSGFQVVLESLIALPYEFVRDTLGNDRLAERLFPLVMSIFMFVLAVNWFGLLPFVATFGPAEGAHGLVPLFYPGATDLNLTLALTVIAFLAIEIAGIVTLGMFRYAGKFINFTSPLAFAIGLIELFSELARLLSFSFRLFGNIFAGKVLILVVMFFIPLIVPIPFLAFEIFVGFIQAAIFALLTLFFVKIAIESHGEHSEEETRHPETDGASLPRRTIINTVS